MPAVQIMATEDGSFTLYVPELDETYHSFHGPAQESQHVYIDMGLRYQLAVQPIQPLQILEIGFGTGLNVLLTWQHMRNDHHRIDFTTLEPFPLDLSVIDQLAYVKKIARSTEEEAKMQELNQRLHMCEWEEPVAIDEWFHFTKWPLKFEDFKPQEYTYDLVYFDAFAPNKQAELWEIPVLEKLYSIMKPGAALVTYCAKGQFKRDLKMVGFDVDVLAGPPGKYQMVRAIKPTVM